LTVGLLVDTSKSQRRVLESERRASYTFLNQVVREGRDAAFGVHFDTNVGVLQALTASRRQLADALARVRPASILAGTLLYTAIRRSSEDQMRKQSRRKAFLLLSDGVDYLSRTSIETAIEYAQRADTIIYAIVYAATSQRGAGKLCNDWLTRQAAGAS
jgi:VWFA-related protein